MPQKLKILSLAPLIALSFSAYAATTEVSDLSEAHDYALKAVYEHIGEKRELNKAELVAVEQIVRIYQDIEAKLQQLPKSQSLKEEPRVGDSATSPNSFDILAERLASLRGEFHEYFLTKNFGTTNDIPTPAPVTDETDTKGVKVDE